MQDVFNADVLAADNADVLAADNAYVLGTTPQMSWLQTSMRLAKSVVSLRL